MIMNESQKKAIAHQDGPCMVLAGPGSGKTAVITQRTKKLITEYNVHPSNILVITFTKAAAMEMKERFLLLMNEAESKVTFGTFHAIFFMVLKLAYHYDRTNIATDEQKYQFMRDIVASFHLEYRDENEFIGNLLGEISKIKNERLAVEHFYSSQCGEEVFRKIYAQYQKRLQQNRMIDFDDMLLYTYELFMERKDILMAWQNKYQYILIDEFQDINQIQFDIIKLLASPKNNLFVVGDDDQSIYRFRGSKPELMLGFERVYPDVKKYLLNVNYRCDQNIVEDSLRLILHNKDRFDKKISANKKKTYPVAYLKFENQRSQNLFIIKQIKEGLAQGKNYRQYAILFRTNTSPRLLTEQLMEFGIPFKMKEHMPSLYEHWIAKDIFTYIRIAKGSRKRADFLQIMNRPKRYIGRDSLCEPEIAFDEWIKLYDEQPWIAERIERLWYDIKMLSNMSPFAAINYIRRGIGYDDYLKEYADYRNMNFDDLLEILEELENTAKGFKSYDAWFLHIEEYAKQMKEQARANSQNEEGILLATLHGAKGLEFDTVYILDVNEGIIPYKKAVLDKDVEEERRLFYVGMTRAREQLNVCFCSSIRDKSMEPSRFIKEVKQFDD